jgi:hypothetical protein
MVHRAEYRELRELLTSSHALQPADIVTARQLLLSLSTFGSVFSRTRKAEVNIPRAVRRATSIEVLWSEEELEVYSSLKDWLIERARTLDQPVPFVTQMPLRLASSCLPVAVDYLRDRVEGHEVLDEELAELLEAEYPELDVDQFHERGGRDIAASERLESKRRKLLEAMDRYDNRSDAKLEQLLLCLDESLQLGNGKVIVFSFFKRTIRYLVEHLSSRYRVLSLTGDTDPTERFGVMHKFRKSDAQILVMSEVGTEGLDFEFCNAMFNYDLPWNPMKVEQRIGRLDRYGQKHDVVHIFNFSINGTIDSQIFERLYERIEIFTESIGVLEPILGAQTQAKLLEIALDPELSESERNDRLLEYQASIFHDAKRVEDIGASSARELLLGTDQLVIEGFENDRRNRGNYVGQYEIESYVCEYLDRSKGGRLIASDVALGVYNLRGTADLAKNIRRQPPRQRGVNAAELAAAINDEVAVEITFSPEVALDFDVPLVSIRHPLARCAQGYFESQLTGDDRVGRIAITHDIFEGDFLVLLYLAETTGLHPRTVILPFAREVVTGEIRTDEGYALLAAVTTTEYSDWIGFGQETVRENLEAIREHAVQWQLDEQSHVQEYNQSRLRQQQETIRVSFETRIKRTRNQLDRDPTNRIVSVLRANIRSLEAEKERRLAELEGLGEAAVLLEPLLVAELRISRRNDDSGGGSVDD